MKRFTFRCTTCPTVITVTTSLPSEPLLIDGSIEVFGYHPEQNGMACYSRDGSAEPAYNCPACGQYIALETIEEDASTRAATSTVAR